MSREFSKVKHDSGASNAARYDNGFGQAAGTGAEQDRAPTKIDPNLTGGCIAHINITRCKSEKDND